MPKTLPARFLPSPAHVRPAPSAPPSLFGKVVPVEALPSRKQLKRVKNSLAIICSHNFPIPYQLTEKS